MYVSIQVKFGTRMKIVAIKTQGILGGVGTDYVSEYYVFFIDDIGYARPVTVVGEDASIRVGQSNIHTYIIILMVSLIPCTVQLDLQLYSV